MLPAEIQAQIKKLPAESQALIEVIVLFYESRIAQLETRVLELESQLSKDSHNSNKPPSSDPPFKPSPKSLRQKSGRKAGGQKGHKGRTLERVSDPDVIERHVVSDCIHCSHDLSSQVAEGIDRRQLFDLPPLQLEVTEHQVEIKRCPCCHRINKAAFPEGLTSAAQYGPNIKALLLYLNNYQMIPYARLSEFMCDFLEQDISCGSICNFQKEAHLHLSEFENTLKDRLKNEALAHFDETGFRVNRHLMWLHLCSNRYYAFYQLHDKRGSAAMEDIGILPYFSGIAIHDFWKSYYHYSCDHALCNAHLLRELIFIHEHYQQDWAMQMIELLTGIKTCVDKARLQQKKKLSASTHYRYKKQYDQLIAQAIGINPVPESPLPKRGRRKKTKPLNLAERMRDYADDVLRFMYDFNVPFDNNQAERDLRMMKVKQKISGTFRSSNGADYFLRIRTYITTARKQGINAFIALQDLLTYQAVPEMLIQGIDGSHITE